MTSGGTSGSATRGFLFADLRGYTAFVERAGAHRAAAMLASYRELVRLLAVLSPFDPAIRGRQLTPAR